MLVFYAFEQINILLESICFKKYFFFCEYIKKNPYTDCFRLYFPQHNCLDYFIKCKNIHTLMTPVMFVIAITTTTFQSTTCKFKVTKLDSFCYPHSLLLLSSALGWSLSLDLFIVCLQLLLLLTLQEKKEKLHF